MSEFARYFVEAFVAWWRQFCSFWRYFGKAFAEGFKLNVYFNTLAEHQDSFNFLSWLMLVIVTSIVVAFVTFCAIKLYQIFKQYFRFRKTEVEKEELLSEIADLHEMVQNLSNEKKQILSLKLGGMSGSNSIDILTGGLVDSREFGEEGFNGYQSYNNYGGMGGQSAFAGAATGAGKPQEEEQTGKRFTKLQIIDDKYNCEKQTINMQPDEMLTLEQIVERFINFSASQMHLYYTKEVISRFFAGMATGKLVILEGISGTGKTSLPYAMSKFFNNDVSIVPVQPSWRDKSEIVGYLNEFTKKFNETDFLKSLYEATYRDDVNYIVLDELNLARIEYYFAEFLSMMEMPDVNEWLIDLVPSTLPEDPKHLMNGKILVPQNVWFIGTANKDDSTFTITDKVYDRATTLILNARADFFDAPITDPLNMSYDYLNSLFIQAHDNYQISDKTMESFQKLDYFIQDNFKIAFGNRIMKQIKLFVPAYMACGYTELEGLDYMLRIKILRKFESLNLAFLKKEIQDLINLLDKFYGKGTFKESIAYLKDLYKMS